MKPSRNPLIFLLSIFSAISILFHTESVLAETHSQFDSAMVITTQWNENTPAWTEIAVLDSYEKLNAESWYFGITKIMTCAINYRLGRIVPEPKDPKNPASFTLYGSQLLPEKMCDLLDYAKGPAKGLIFKENSTLIGVVDQHGYWLMATPVLNDYSVQDIVVRIKPLSP